MSPIEKIKEFNPFKFGMGKAALISFTPEGKTMQHMQTQARKISVEYKVSRNHGIDAYHHLMKGDVEGAKKSLEQNKYAPKVIEKVLNAMHVLRKVQEPDQVLEPLPESEKLRELEPLPDEEPSEKNLVAPLPITPVLNTETKQGFKDKQLLSAIEKLNEEIKNHPAVGGNDLLTAELITSVQIAKEISAIRNKIQGIEHKDAINLHQQINHLLDLHRMEAIKRIPGAEDTDDLILKDLHNSVINSKDLTDLTHTAEILLPEVDKKDLKSVLVTMQCINRWRDY